MRTEITKRKLVLVIGEVEKYFVFIFSQHLFQKTCSPNVKADGMVLYRRLMVFEWGQKQLGYLGRE